MLVGRKGQSIVEYAILLGVVITALLIMQVFVKRGYQGGLKESADKIGEQFSENATTTSQNRTMASGDNQKITEYVATGTEIKDFLPAGAEAKQLVGVANKAYSYTERTGGQVTTESQSKTGSIEQERELTKTQ